MTRMTNGERLASIETLLKLHVEDTTRRLDENGEAAKEALTLIRELDRKVDCGFAKRDERIARDEKNLAEWQNKGKGAFAVVSVVFTSIGALVMAMWDRLFPH